MAPSTERSASRLCGRTRDSVRGATLAPALGSRARDESGVEDGSGGKLMLETLGKDEEGRTRERAAPPSNSRSGAKDRKAQALTTQTLSLASIERCSLTGTA